MARSVERPRTPSARSEGSSSSAPSSPCTPQIRAVNPSPFKAKQQKEIQSSSPPAPHRLARDYSVALDSLYLPQARPASSLSDHARSTYNTIKEKISARFSRREHPRAPASPQSDCATFAPSPPFPPPSPGSATSSLTKDAPPSAPATFADIPRMKRFVAGVKAVKAGFSRKTRTSRKAPKVEQPSRKVVKKRKAGFGLYIRQHKKDLESPAERAAATLLDIKRKRPRVGGGSARSRIAKEDAADEARASDKKMGSAATAAYYASLSSPLRHSRERAHPVSSSKKCRLPPRLSPASQRTFIHRAPPSPRITELVRPLRESMDAEEGEEPQTDDGDEDYEDIEADFCRHESSFSRSSAPSPASTRLFRLSRTDAGMQVTLTAGLNVEASVATTPRTTGSTRREKLQPVVAHFDSHIAWSAHSTPRAHDTAHETPTTLEEQRELYSSIYSTLAFHGGSPTPEAFEDAPSDENDEDVSEGELARPPSASGSGTGTDTSDASAQDLATAQYRLVDVVVPIAVAPVGPRLPSLEPGSPFKPRRALGLLSSSPVPQPQPQSRTSTAVFLAPAPEDEAARAALIDAGRRVFGEGNAVARARGGEASDVGVGVKGSGVVREGGRARKVLRERQG